jgi:predicted RNase H-like HicB family nuclease
LGALTYHVQEGTIANGRSVENPNSARATAGGRFRGQEPTFPELITDGDTLQYAIEHAQDAVTAVLELYEDLGKSIPESLRQDLDDRCGGA